MSSDNDLTLRQKAYFTIQNKLLSGEIQAGDLVSEQALAEAIGMSRTPVREAIGQLEIEGLFDKVPRVGTLVRLPGQRELSELYGVREALESHAASIAANVLSTDTLTKMERWQQDLTNLIQAAKDNHSEALDNSLLRRFFDADMGFHSIIVGSTENGRTLKIVNEFRVVQRVFEYGRMSYTIDFVEAVRREHGEILSALQRGDSEQARVSMAAHIRSSCEHAMARFGDSTGAQASVQSGSGHSRHKQRPRHRQSVTAKSE